ncbi:MAG: prohibitin family protein [Chloroflexota bacterium]|nr:prohibitin family protein [Chloroflexota bacterium]
MEEGRGFSFRIVGIVVLVILAAVVIFSSYTIVDPGHRGVVIMLGRVEDRTLGEGFHLIMPPVVRRVVQVDVRTKKLEITTEAASSDLQVMDVTAALNYHPDPANASKLYREVGPDYESIIIAPALQEAIKAATARLRVENILGERAKLKEDILESLTKRLFEENYLVIDQLSLANIEFSPEFNAAIEKKQVAEQEALRKEYELQAAQKEAEIAVAKAEGEKRAAIVAAEGRAESRRLEAQAEAEALGIIAKQLEGNPDLIKYEWATNLSPSVRTVLLPSEQAIMLNAESLVGGE